jgi:hypothetical protein
LQTKQTPTGQCQCRFARSAGKNTTTKTTNYALIARRLTTTNKFFTVKKSNFTKTNYANQEIQMIKFNKQVVLATLGWGVLFTVIAGFILGKFSGAINCQADFQCAYSLIGSEWLPLTSVLVGVAVSSFVVRLGSNDLAVAQVVVD